MAEILKMPKLGMDMSEGVVVKWLKTEGDAVRKGEALAEIETDKSTMEVEAPIEGTLLRLYVPEGTAVACGHPIAAIGRPGEPAPDAAAAAPAPPQDGAPAVPCPEDGECAGRRDGKRRSSPRARRLAEKNRIDLSLLTGTGPAGRIVEQDVRAYLDREAHVGSQAEGRRRRETVAPLQGIRKITAERMRQSLSEMAQANHRTDVDMSDLIALRKQVNARLAPQGIHVSFVDLLIAICAKALIAFPAANSSLREDGLHTPSFANVGIAVATDRGLVVPVLQDADVLSLPEIAQKSRALIDKARRGVLQADEMRGGTFTISNLGMYEIDSFTAIVNPPETCILAVGQIADRAVAVNGQICLRPMMTLSLSYDHRVLDGAPAAEYLQSIKRYIEYPIWIFL